jgi:hypothetical protein
MAFISAFASPWLVSILASRHSIICCISIVWRFNDKIQCSVQHNPTSDTSCHLYGWLIRRGLDW